LGVTTGAGFAFGFATAGAAAGFDLGFLSFVLGFSSMPRKHINFRRLLNRAMASYRCRCFD
jgi:hypothetical protein